MKLCEFLRLHRQDIISEWVALLNRSVSERYNRLPAAELEKTVTRAYDANYSVICDHNWQPIEEFIVFITRIRLEREFTLSEVQRAFGIFRTIMINRLPLIFHGEELKHALLSINNSVDVTINWFSEYFQEKHEEEMKALLKTLEQKAKKRTEELYNSEKRYRTLVEDINDGYFVCRNQQVIFANRAFGEMFGKEASALIGKHYDDLFANLDEQFTAVAKPEIFEARAVRTDSSEFPVEIKVNQVTFEGQQALAGVCRDITERRESVRKELEHERLAIIGRLATVFAHEIRNSLSSIKVNIRILQRKLELAENDSRRMAIILRDIDKLDKILQETLYFSKPIEISPSSHDINTVLEMVISGFEEVLNLNGITLSRQLSPGIPELTIDHTMMEMVFDNLIRNAIEALGEQKGQKKLTISTRRQQKNMVAITIHDNGSGISKDDLAHIFQPFYTTRKHGIGLGLSNVERVIEEHGGHIIATSSPETGTLFTVSLPGMK
ncbi:MAG: PAS domain S-box protein [Deltaproteobacteria bacterium]|nr:PAS domain S-box protein [Candidatus Anaeroferrophillus wilburensis]MBN2888515.1 PAS domain S-box protein [Deltaproteobacteria bacterium]